MEEVLLTGAALRDRVRRGDEAGIADVRGGRADPGLLEIVIERLVEDPLGVDEVAVPQTDVLVCDAIDIRRDGPRRPRARAEHENDQQA